MIGESPSSISTAHRSLCMLMHSRCASMANGVLGSAGASADASHECGVGVHVRLTLTFSFTT